MLNLRNYELQNIEIKITIEAAQEGDIPPPLKIRPCVLVSVGFRHFNIEESVKNKRSRILDNQLHCGRIRYVI